MERFAWLVEYLKNVNRQKGNKMNEITKDYGYIKNKESQYVYRYIHPNYPWLYVGRTNDLARRIYEHDEEITDNIDKKYKKLLLESFVVYTELDNKAQSIALENYLIDVYKPTLNKYNKYYGKSIFNIYDINWKKYIRTADFSCFTSDNKNNKFNIGRYIKAQRINIGYTIENLSNITGISQRTISRIENGKNNVNFETIVTILNSLELFDIVCNSIENSVCLNNKFRVRDSKYNIVKNLYE